jgi:isopentenyldiphosphate isomerase
MENEWLSEVDERDVVIGPRARGDIHRLKLRHRSVHILVFNAQGEVFMQRRSPGKDINPGLWDTSAAGHVDHGEEYDQSARRELLEELGIDAAGSLERLFKLPASADTGWEFVQVYRLTHAGPLRLNAEEITGGHWYAPAAVDAWIGQGGQELTISFQVIWNCFRRL